MPKGAMPCTDLPRESLCTVRARRCGVSSTVETPMLIFPDSHRKIRSLTRCNGHPAGRTRFSASTNPLPQWSFRSDTLQEPLWTALWATRYFGLSERLLRSAKVVWPGMQGLAEKKDKLGAPLCPCRHYDDEQAEANQGFWNCPCVPMRERKV